MTGLLGLPLLLSSFTEISTSFCVSFAAAAAAAFRVSLDFRHLENPVEDQKVEWVHEQENDADAVSTTLGFTEGLPPTSGVVEVLDE
jgi:hypothetical protein